MYIYKIAPKSKTQKQDTYDYLSDDPLESGTIVQIELGRSKIAGIVIAEAERKTFATKKILKILSKGPAFTAAQIELARKIKEEYLSAFGETLFAFLPTMNVSDIKLLGAPRSRTKRISRKSELFLSSFPSRLSYYTQLASKDQKQVLIVLPEIDQIDQAYKNLKKLLPHKKIFTYYSSLKSDQKRKIWNEALGGNDLIVISTRHGLLLPFTNLSLTCLDDPLNFAYQEDQAPYYQAFLVARKLRETVGCNMVIGESIPDMVSFVAYKKNNLEVRKVESHLKIKLSPPFSKFGQNIALLNEIERTLSRGKRVCFIGPWRNQIKLACSACETNIRCAKCNSEFFDEEIYSCTICAGHVLNCPNCKGIKLRAVGFSYKLIEDEIAKTFPRYKNAITQAPDHFKDHQIIIASPNDIMESKVHLSLAVFPYFDKMIDFAALGYRHKIFRLVFDLAKLQTEEVFLCGENLSENRFSVQVARYDWRNFLDDELQNRSKLKLPPFSKAIIAVCKAKTIDLVRKQFDRITMETGIEILPLREQKQAEYVRQKGLFFVPNTRWPKIKTILVKTKLKNCHFEIDRGEYL